MRWRWHIGAKIGVCLPLGLRRQHNNDANERRPLPVDGGGVTCGRFVRRRHRYRRSAQSPPPHPHPPRQSTDSTAPLNFSSQSPLSPDLPSRKVTNLRRSKSTASLPRRLKRSSKHLAPPSPEANSDPGPPQPSERPVLAVDTDVAVVEYLPDVDTAPDFEANSITSDFDTRSESAAAGTPPKSPACKPNPTISEPDAEIEAQSVAVQDPVAERLAALSPEELNKEFKSRIFQEQKSSIDDYKENQIGNQAPSNQNISLCEPDTAIILDNTVVKEEKGQNTIFAAPRSGHSTTSNPRDLPGAKLTFFGRGALPSFTYQSITTPVYTNSSLNSSKQARTEDSSETESDIQEEAAAATIPIIEGEELLKEAAITPESPILDEQEETIDDYFEIPSSTESEGESTNEDLASSPPTSEKESTEEVQSSDTIEAAASSSSSSSSSSEGPELEEDDDEEEENEEAEKQENSERVPATPSQAKAKSADEHKEWWERSDDSAEDCDDEAEFSDDDESSDVSDVQGDSEGEESITADVVVEVEEDEDEKPLPVKEKKEVPKEKKRVAAPKYASQDKEWWEADSDEGFSDDYSEDSGDESDNESDDSDDLEDDSDSEWEKDFDAEAGVYRNSRLIQESSAVSPDSERRFIKAAAETKEDTERFVYTARSSDEEEPVTKGNSIVANGADVEEPCQRFLEYLAREKARITAPPEPPSEDEDDIQYPPRTQNHRILTPGPSLLRNPLTRKQIRKAMSRLPDIASSSKSDTTTAPAAPKKEQKGKQPQQAATEAAATTDGAPKKLTGKELKEQKKAEKQARRAADKQQKEAGAPNTAPNTGSSSQGKPAQISASSGNVPAGPKTPQGQSSKGKKAQPAEPDAPEPKKIPFFDHLKEDKPEIDLLKLNKDVHPSIGKLSMKLRNFDIMGSTARCLHMLIAFKEVINDYTTPEGASLARNLTQHLGIQISQITAGRKLSISQGNAIRWLKTIIIDIKPDVPEKEAKEGLHAAIDNYIKERIIAAQEVIARIASDKINDGDTILTFAKSSCVERVIRQAIIKGKRFTVVCIDSRPYFEGKQLAKSLSASGIQVKYAIFSALSQVMKKVDKVFLGAHAVFANGSCYSRAGTSAVAMTAAEYQKPVLICCEGIKLSDKIAVDSITTNELGPAEALIPEDSPLQNHAEIPNLHVVNLLYDITPPKYITSVVTEVGQVPPTGIPSVHRLMAEREGTFGAA